MKRESELRDSKVRDSNVPVTRTNDLSIWAPKIDMYEKDGRLFVKTDLPGLNSSDVEVAVEDGQLIVRGEREHSSRIDGENDYRPERTYGSFYRRIALPDGFDPSTITTRIVDGVLEVDAPLPKVETSKHQTIEVA